ncbi:hypothetical protein ACHAQH_006457 [Verticillium albo-atrum]
MTLPFTTLDVFTETRLKGNPLAVVTIPHGTQLTQGQKQAIAREFNLSETTFVHDVADPASTTERRFDIFTPRAELPFAGHPTIGTAAILQSQGVRTLVAKAGTIQIDQTADGSLRAAIPHNVRLHGQSVPAVPCGAQTAAETALAEAEVGAPLFSIVKGMTFALVEVASLEVLGAAKAGLMPELPADLLDDGWREGWETRRYYFCWQGSRTVDGREVYTIRTRMVKKALEDPATGSAACALCGYLALHRLEGVSIGFEIVQGVEMGRESTILVDVELGRGQTGEREMTSLHLGGKAVPIMDGTIRI